MCAKGMDAIVGVVDGESFGIRFRVKRLPECLLYFGCFVFLSLMPHMVMPVELKPHTLRLYIVVYDLIVTEKTVLMVPPVHMRVAAHLVLVRRLDGDSDGDLHDGDFVHGSCAGVCRRRDDAAVGIRLWCILDIGRGCDGRCSGGSWGLSRRSWRIGLDVVHGDAACAL